MVPSTENEIPFASFSCPSNDIDSLVFILVKDTVESKEAAPKTSPFHAILRIVFSCSPIFVSSSESIRCIFLPQQAIIFLSGCHLQSHSLSFKSYCAFKIGFIWKLLVLQDGPSNCKCFKRCASSAF
eukprot:NODE_76_length_23341_cov_0.477498.p10 type:complete len:127 gc:universal NODE_76_length_23341_cov_0.477498:11426-11046(-)